MKRDSQTRDELNTSSDFDARNHRVSVIIPAYKAEGTIRRAIDSVLAQSNQIEQILVVDDGSPDDLTGVVQRTYGDRIQLIRQPNGRTAKARNTGIEHATGEFLAFLDADDYWEPDKVAKQLQLFQSHPELGLVAGRFYNELPGGERTCGVVRRQFSSLYDCVLFPKGAQAFQLATMAWTGMVMMRREALGDQRFETGLEPAEDRDLWVRIISKWPTYLTSEPLATAVLEEGSLSRSSIDRDCSNMLKVIERHSQLLGPIATRKWRSHTLYRWAANDPNPTASLLHLTHSIALWPIPYRNIPSMQALGRIKRLAVMIARFCKLRK